MFESNVIYIGTKTVSHFYIMRSQFESNVIYIGTKTKKNKNIKITPFESNVIYIGTKTNTLFFTETTCLRVM